MSMNATNEFYMLLTSADGSASDFSVQLPQKLIIDDSWKVALVDIFFHQKLGSGETSLYFTIECDVVEPSVVIDHFRPILLTVPMSSGTKWVYYAPFKPQYHRAINSDRNELHFRIRDPNGKISSFFTKSTKVTLHFKKDL